MHSTHLLLEEPIRMASILEPSKPSFFPAMTKIVGTLGSKSRSVEVISACLKVGMSVARFDFSWGDVDYHQETLENLKTAVKSTKKLCAVMLDTVGPELQVVNKSGNAISLEADATVVLTPDQNKEASSELLPINFTGLAKAVKSGDTIFIGQYLFTGSETTSVWLEVTETQGDDVVCAIKNTATLAGSLFTLHISQVHIDLPTLSEADKDVISKWGVRNKIDFLSLSYTRHAEDVRHARDFLSRLGELQQTQIFAKIENIEGLTHFDEILQEADGIILSRGNLGIDLPPEKLLHNGMCLDYAHSAVTSSVLAMHGQKLSPAAAVNRVLRSAMVGRCMEPQVMPSSQGENNSCYKTLFTRKRQSEWTTVC